MNVDQYKNEHRACQKRIIWRFFSAVAVMMAILALCIPIRYMVDPFYEPFIGPCCVLTAFPLLIIGIRSADNAYRAFPNLACRHCGIGLFQSKSVIIATGNCPGCGRRVLNDDAIGT